jgi:hypothetical protein
MKRRTIFQGLAALAVIPFIPKIIQLEEPKSFNVTGDITCYFDDTDLYQIMLEISGKQGLSASDIDLSDMMTKEIKGVYYEA